MTDLRAAAQQALEALDLCHYWPGAYDECSSAITALRAALAQQAQAQEPMAINCKAKRDNGGVCPHHNLHCGWPDCNKPPR